MIEHIWYVWYDIDQDMLMLGLSNKLLLNGRNLFYIGEFD